MKRNFLALTVVLAILIVFPAGLFAYQAWRTQAAGVRVIDITARAPQDGGFAPDHLQLLAGETVRLRISSPDVVHGLAIPGLGVEVTEILPGKPVEVDLTAPRPGRYAFACTRWCGADHWRMRGVIEVAARDPGAPAGQDGTGLPDPARPDVPLYQTLGLDLDAPRPEATAVPTGLPSADRGAALGRELPVTLGDAAVRPGMAPVEGFARLRADPDYAGLSDGQIWDLVAWAWLKDSKPEMQAEAQKLYARDCAACHGPEGRGDGPAGKGLPGLSMAQATATPGTGMDAMQPAGPADFTNARRMLAASDAVLQGKILRGGMGTGMPEFGSLYTSDQMWALVAYVRGFLFQVQDPH